MTGPSSPSQHQTNEPPWPGRIPRQGWLDKRRQKVLEEIERNRRGEYVVPTWVLGAILFVIVAGLVALFIFF